MSYTASGGPKGLGVFGSTPQTVADLNQLVTLIARVGNYRGQVTEAQRDAITGTALYAGLVLFNSDSGALEMYSGSGWDQLIPAPGSANVTLETGWQNQDQVLKVTRRSGIGFLTGRVSRASGSSTKVGTMPAGYRPVETTHASLNSLGSAATDGARFIVTANANGDITVAHLSGSPAWNTGSWLSINMTFPVS